VTLSVDVVRDWVDYATAFGTVGAAVVATTAVIITGRQGAQQQRLLVAAQERDAVERRADFELGVLMQLAATTRETWRWQPMGESDDQQAVRALLIALPPELLPILRARVAPRDDTLAQERLEPFRGHEDSRIRIQRAIDRELRDAIFERRDAPRVSNPLAPNRWRWTWTFGR
jgi:hypothetical protein